MTNCCADCGEEGGASLKACKSCMLVKYCNADCQRNHWPKHKSVCKRRAAEIHTRRCSRVLRLKRTVPSASYQCLRIRYVVCLFHPRLFVPIYDLSIATKQLEIQAMKHYYPCCGKSICGGCVYRTPFVETMRNVLFAMRGWAKQKKKELKN